MTCRARGIAICVRDGCRATKGLARPETTSERAPWIGRGGWMGARRADHKLFDCFFSGQLSRPFNRWSRHSRNGFKSPTAVVTACTHDAHADTLAGSYSGLVLANAVRPFLGSYAPTGSTPIGYCCKKPARQR
jgi:hypothetical protein